MEVLKKAYAHNKVIAAAIILFYLYTLLILPIWLLPISLWWAASLIPFIWIHVTHWGLVHEAIHKHLAIDNQENEKWGRGLSVLMGVSLHIVRFGHMMHHKLNREWQSEIVEEKGFKQRAAYYYELLCGLYISEFLTGFAMTILPREKFLKLAGTKDLIANPAVFTAGERVFYVKENVKYVRVDMILSIILHTSSFLLYGAYWPVLAALIVVRAVVISFMDNIYHYGTEMDEAGKDLELPKWASAVLLNSNYHNAHHRNPAVPWKELPRVHAENNYGFKGKFAKHGLMQLKGPILKLAAQERHEGQTHQMAW